MSKKRRLLVVDDNRPNLDRIRRAFTPAYEVATAELGTAALEAVRNMTPDVIVADQRIPEMTGVELFRLLETEIPDAIRVLVTGIADFDLLRDAVNMARIDQLVEEPCNPRQLRALVDALCEKQEIQTRLRENEGGYRFIVESTSDAIITSDSTGRITSWNGAARRMFGYPSSEILGRPIRVLMPERFRVPHETGMARLIEGQEPRVVGRTVEVAGVSKDGREFPLELTLSMWHTRRGPQFGGILRDITKRKKAEQRLRDVALHDALTSLPNRILFFDRLARAAKLAQRGGDLFAVLYLDLDGFKEINDRFGHKVGDMTLAEVAVRLAGSIRDSDTVARMGGDEFTVLLHRISSPDDAVHVAKKIIDAMDAPLELSPPRRVGVSIGIACYPQDNTDIESLVTLADRAMYRAKRIDGSSYQLAAQLQDPCFIDNP